MAVLSGFPRIPPLRREPAASRVSARAASVFATLTALAGHGRDAAAQIAVFLWMALVVALFGVVAAGFLLA